MDCLLLSTMFLFWKTYPNLDIWGWIIQIFDIKQMCKLPIIHSLPHDSVLNSDIGTFDHFGISSKEFICCLPDSVTVNFRAQLYQIFPGRPFAWIHSDLSDRNNWNILHNCTCHAEDNKVILQRIVSTNISIGITQWNVLMNISL